MPTISVVIPAFNEEKYIAECLQSILDHRTSDVKEVIVVDNASTDRTAEIARGFPGVTVALAEHKGITWARQRGLETATGDILAWVDADCRVDRKWFETIASSFGDERVAGISGPYWYYDGPLALRLLCDVLWVVCSKPIYWVTRTMVIGGNFAARRSALLQMGGFDTSIEFYGEDVDIGRRLQRVGKVKFMLSFANRSSMRRYTSIGLFKTGYHYTANFLGMMLFGKTVTATHADVR